MLGYYGLSRGDKMGFSPKPRQDSGILHLRLYSRGLVSIYLKYKPFTIERFYDRLRNVLQIASLFHTI